MGKNSPNGPGELDLGWRPISRHRMARLGNRRMGRQRRFLFTLFRAVDRHRKAQESYRPNFILVAQPDWLASSFDLRNSSAGLSFYFCLRVHVDSLHPEYFNPLSK